MLTRNDPSFAADVSEQEVCWEGYMGSTNGGWGSSVLTYFTTHGVVSAAECPYQSSSPNTGIAPYWPLASGWQNRVWQSTSNLNDFTNDTNTMKAYLKMVGPLEVGIWASHDLYSSVASLETSYRPPDGSTCDHEVSLVGYCDDAKVPTGGYWIIKNSWGTGEGQNGYDFIPYGNIEVHNDISAITGAVYYTGAMANATWNGGAGTWSKGGTRWNSSSYAWENKETSATFAGTGGAVTVSGAVIAHSITINSTGYTFNGGSMTVTAGGIQANQSTTIGSAVYIGGPQSWNVASGKTVTVNGPLHTIISDLTFNGAGNTVIAGAIDGGGVINTYGGAKPGGLIQAGTGALTLTGTSNYAGDITVNSGAGMLYLSPGSGTSTYSGLLLGGGSVVVGGAGTVAFAGSSNFSGTINLQTGTLNFAPAAGVSGSYSGITGAGSVQKSGLGTTALTGANSYSGTTTVSAGTLDCSTAASLSPGYYAVTGGTLLLGNKSPTVAGLQVTAGTLSGNGTIISNSTYDIQGGSVNAVLGGNVGLNKTGTGTAVLLTNQTYTGPTTISAGTLQFGGLRSMVGGVAGNIAIGTGGTLSFNRSNGVTYASQLSGTGMLLVSGYGTVTMTGANSFSGSISTTHGTLDYSGNSTLPAGNYIIGGALNIGTLSQSIGAFQVTTGTVTGTGTLTSNATYDVRGGRVDANLAGNSIALTKSGSTAALLTGANSYTGRTTVTGGTLELGPSAQSCVLNVGGADIQSGSMVFDYAGGADPAATIESLLKASYDGGRWDVGQFRDSTAAATGLTLGCFDNTASSQVKVMATYPGDFNLDGVVDGLDRAIWCANAFTGTTWQQGDANYDGVVDGLDRDLWFSHVGLPKIAGALPAVEAVTPAPEPGALALLSAGLLGLLACAWKKRE